MNKLGSFLLSFLLLIGLVGEFDTNLQVWGQAGLEPNFPVQNNLVSHEIPDWIKNDAKLWATGRETDDTFVNTIQYLIKEKIILIDTNDHNTTTVHIPEWFKFNGAWFGNGRISDDDFVLAIQFLIKKGILSVPLGPETSDSETPNYILYNKGWDPTFSKRRIANIFPNNTETYFESCPDTKTGRCFPDVKNAGGFWTLSTEIGGIKQPCKTNSHNKLIITELPEPCPFFFKWGREETGKGVVAVLEINNTLWNQTFTPNIWMGFNHVHQQGSLYVGGNSSISMHNNNATINVNLSGGKMENTNNLFNGDARFVIGFVWFSPKENKSFDIEFNVGNVLRNDGTIQDSWSSSKRIARNEYVALDNTNYVYLGGTEWGLPTLSSINESTYYAINWGDVISRLVNDKILPESVLTDNRPGVNFIGIEQHGKLHTLLKIENYKMGEVHFKY